MLRLLCPVALVTAFAVPAMQEEAVLAEHAVPQEDLPTARELVKKLDASYATFTAEFTEYTIVLKGMIRVEHEGGAEDVPAGRAIVAHPGEWVRYSTPGTQGAEYIAVCVPAFTPDTVHRDP